MIYKQDKGGNEQIIAALVVYSYTKEKSNPPLLHDFIVRQRSNLEVGEVCKLYTKGDTD